MAPPQKRAVRPLHFPNLSFLHFPRFLRRLCDEMYVPLIAAVLVLIVSANAYVVDEDWNLRSSGGSPADTNNEPLDHGLLERRSGATCGPSANNAVCASNLCCGPNV
jgi:hypothetical protein